MTDRVRPDGTPDEATLLHEQYLPALIHVGTSEFGLPRPAARALACDVLMASLGAASRISDLRTWLIAAMRAAAKSYQQRTDHASRP